MNNNGKGLEGLRESVSKMNDGQSDTQSLYSYQVCPKFQLKKRKADCKTNLQIIECFISLTFRAP